MHTSKLLALALGVILPHFTRADPRCSEISFDTTIRSAKAEKIELPSLNLNTPDLIGGLLNSVLGYVGHIWPLVPVEGTYSISATFCEPETYNGADAVQILVHGATYNKLYWSGLGLPHDQAEPYDWARFAATKGYAVLAIDRPGAGNSSHPDPLLKVQANLEAEVLHQTVLQLRNGRIGGKKFPKVVGVGHSLGSVFAMRATQLYPQDFDALVLTGWSVNFVENLPKLLKTGILPARVGIPERFVHLELLYLAGTIRRAIRDLFYGPEGTFDPDIERYNWEHRDVVAAGELITILSGSTETTYAGPVQIINGQLDSLFCSPTDGKCAPGPDAPPGNTAPLFPSAVNFTTNIVPNTGHCLNLHHSARETFSIAHDFLHDNIVEV
ncbi:alpha/beta hydrolase [Aspergillus candidus]|uniref:Alpha/beta-hydrolase n=1 Tax=Aspergillus candidus TaxID=41067 RepID=A0A2I2F7B6_ASPCN|nr:alpha/beta-hydrolase [Aspergillus candidus]PLB36516.1 alpha/beta-hydrolase [Aspergillus candidus]